MFDPEVDLDARLAQELKLKPGAIPFYEKPECNEEELKYLTTSFEKIRGAIHRYHNRIVDARAWTSNPYVLITLNLDTVDRQIAQAGYSLRIRCAYNGDNVDHPISQIDMSIKTALPTGKKVIMSQTNRGEWEAELFSLEPSMAAMIEQNKRKTPPLPYFFRNGHIRDNELFVEDIGATLRNVFPSYETFRRHGKILASSFQHTEDALNIFMTPYADIVTGEDSEAESEFRGIYNLTDEDAAPDDFEKLMNKSKRLLDRIIVTADPDNIQRNLLAKSVRARHGLETVYGPPVSVNGLSDTFDYERRVDQAVRFALSQHVRPQDVNFTNIWHHVAAMKVKVERIMAPVDDTFQPAKYMR